MMARQRVSVSDHRAGTLAMPAARARAMPGRGVLEVQRVGPRSVVTRAYATSPLRLLTPANHGDAAWIYTSSHGGGLVDGDDIRLDVHLGRGAAAFVSTQASTKVYRSPRGTRTELHGQVDAGALLVVAPDPVVPFAQARYRQVQRLDVAGEGGLVLVDLLSSGRCAAGERWAFSDYQALVEVRIDGRRLVHDSVALRASDGDLAARMGRFDVLALVIVAGGALECEVGSLIAAADRDVVRRAPQLVTVSPLGDRGCIVRAAGTSVETVGRTLRRLLAFVPIRLGEDPWTRKW
jgi:urease accessory protein